nr:hypothetical protein [Pseudonocardia sp. AL041005-10]
MPEQAGEVLRPAAVHPDGDHPALPTLSGERSGPGHREPDGVLDRDVPGRGECPQLSDALPDDGDRVEARLDQRALGGDADREDLHVLQVGAPLGSHLAALDESGRHRWKVQFAGGVVDAGEYLAYAVVPGVQIVQDPATRRGHRSRHDEDRGRVHASSLSVGQTEQVRSSRSAARDFLSDHKNPQQVWLSIRTSP